MEWEGRQESSNVEDRRGRNMKAGLSIGGGGLLLVLIIALVLGVDPQALLQQMPTQPGNGNNTQISETEEERMAKFTKVVFRDTEIVWTKLFRQTGRTYREPTLVLYSEQVNSGCGSASSAVGPFYCPADQRVYIDLSFYVDMEKKLNAPGEFARAYVVAHEVGHHVQRLLGYSARVDEARQTKSKIEYNKMSVRQELQADYLAGVWAHHADKEFEKFLEPGDMDSAIKAAYEIGDDRLQKKRNGFSVPHTYTHGTSEQRIRWFRKGFETGNLKGADALFDLPYGSL